MYTGTYECRSNRTYKERKPESCVKMFSGNIFHMESTWKSKIKQQGIYCEIEDKKRYLKYE